MEASGHNVVLANALLEEFTSLYKKGVISPEAIMDVIGGHLSMYRKGSVASDWRCADRVSCQDRERDSEYAMTESPSARVTKLPFQQPPHSNVSQCVVLEKLNDATNKTSFLDATCLHDCCFCPEVQCNAAGSVVLVSILPSMGNVSNDIWSLPSLETLRIVARGYGNMTDWDLMKYIAVNGTLVTELAGNFPFPDVVPVNFSNLVVYGSFTNAIRLPEKRYGTIQLAASWSSGVPRSLVSNTMYALQLAGSFNSSLPVVAPSPSLQFLSIEGAAGGRILDLGPLPAGLRLLDLSLDFLTGIIPESVFSLSALEYLVLAVNELTGPISNNLGKLQSLVYLDLDSNTLEGPIPASVGDLQTLQVLLLYGNGLLGDIPDSIGNLHSLLNLSLFANQLSGQIPRTLGNLSMVREIHLFSNQLNGTLPPEVGQLQNLVQLDLRFNDISGPIPGSIGNARSLQVLDLSFNKFNDCIPFSLGSMTSLWSLNLRSNMLNCRIPQDLGFAAALEYVDLSFNFLQEDIPETLGLLQNLIHLDVSYNNLSDPKACAPLSGQITYLNFRSNQLKGTIIQCVCNQSDLLFLSLGENHLDHFPSCSLPSLVQLDLSNNQITFFPFDLLHQYRSLISLDLSNNLLSGRFPRIAFIGVLPLKSLSLANNNFSDTFPIYACNFVDETTGEIIDVNVSTGLDSLDLSGNQITGIPGWTDFRTCDACLGPGYFTLSNLVLQNASLPSRFLALSLPSASTVCNVRPLTFFDMVLHLPGLVSLDLSNNNVSSHLEFIFSLTLLEMLDIRQNANARKSTLSFSNQNRFSYNSLSTFLYGYTMTCVEAVIEGQLHFQADPSFFNFENCICSQGYYGKPPNCFACLDNAVCSIPVGTIEKISNFSLVFAQSGNVLAQSGYYASPPVTWEQMMNDKAYPTVMEVCAQAGTSLTPCQATNGGFCAQGYEGRLCSSCSSDYFSSGDRCVSCPNSVGLVFYGILLVFLATGALTWSFLVGISSSGIVKVFVFFWQALSFIRAPMPHGLYVVSHGISAAVTLAIAGPECIFRKWSYMDAYLVSALSPVVSMLFIALIWCVGYFMFRFRQQHLEGCTLQHWSDRCYRAAVFMFMLRFQSVMSTILAPLACTSDPGDGIAYMVYYPNQKCSQSLQALSGCLLLLYCAVFPGLLWYLVWKSGVLAIRSGDDDDQSRGSYVLSLIIGSYSADNRWWEIVVTIRRLFFVASFVTISRFSEFRGFLVSSVLVFAIVAQSLRRPFRRTSLNSLETASLAILLMNLVCELQGSIVGVLYVNDVGALLFLVNVSFSILCIVLQVYHLFKRHRGYVEVSVNTSVKELTIMT
eukprot:ANDGO_01863.mRNA.1 Receptor-like protein 12